MKNESRIMSHAFTTCTKMLLTFIMLASCFMTLASVQNAQTPTSAIRQEVKAVREGSKGKIVRLEKALVISIGTNTLTITSGGKTYTVNITSSTNLRRHYFGKGTLAEISVNDQVDIVGTYTDDTGTKITARLVRDTSIMKRRGAFFGTIADITGNTITLDSVKGSQTVTVSTTTKYMNQKGTTILLTDLKNGDLIRVAGLWDKANSTITEVTGVKDFTLIQ